MFKCQWSYLVILTCSLCWLVDVGAWVELTDRWCAHSVDCWILVCCWCWQMELFVTCICGCFITGSTTNKKMMYWWQGDGVFRGAILVSTEATHKSVFMFIFCMTGADWRMFAQRVGVSDSLLATWQQMKIAQPMRNVLCVWAASPGATVRMLHRHLISPQMRCLLLARRISDYYQVDWQSAVMSEYGGSFSCMSKWLLQSGQTVHTPESFRMTFHIWQWLSSSSLTLHSHWLL